MAQRTVDFVQGEYYHIYNRGARRVSLFHSDGEYSFVLRLLADYTRLLNISMIAYCLLPNHYHWLVRQDGAYRAGLLPQRVFNSYSKAYHRLHGTNGTLFEGRFKAIPVNQEAYLRSLCAYIHGNPVHHALAVAPELWPYSNYLDWIGERQTTLIDPRFISDRFPSGEAYRRFVLNYLRNRRDLPAGLGAYLSSLDLG